MDSKTKDFLSIYKVDLIYNNFKCNVSLIFADLMTLDYVTLLLFENIN